ncbi:nucleotide sugar dehydrogenase [Rhodospirillales bacterium]|nr:nucleotide sugar dehydrogenase [Rhodospirillales bacterium]
MPNPIIGYAGLTHLGLTSAAAAADKGFEVIGFHDDASYVSAINEGKLPVTEPGLNELVEKNKARLNFSDDAKSLSRCDLVYISVDVPTDDHGNSDLTPINKMITASEAVMRPGALLIILCQVPPGFTRNLSRSSEQLYYQVETLIFGSSVERATLPERFIIGCVNPDQKIDSRLEEFLGSFNCPLLPMRYESAELAKISINMCLVASVSVANTMAEICENVGADWSEIVPSLKLDKRIGEFSYLKPGLGIAGGNLERDLIIQLSEMHQTDGGIVAAWIKNSAYRKEWAWRTMNEIVLRLNPNARIGILGLAYKENTHSTKNSPSLALLSHLDGFEVCVHDPVVSSDEAGIAVSSSINAEDVATAADVLAIMTPWPEYAELDLNKISSLMSGRILIDPYAVLDGQHVIEAGLEYFTLGLSDLPNQSDSATIHA